VPAGCWALQYADLGYREWAAWPLFWSALEAALLTAAVLATVAVLDVRRDLAAAVYLASGLVDLAASLEDRGRRGLA